MYDKGYVSTTRYETDRPLEDESRRDYRGPSLSSKETQERMFME